MTTTTETPALYRAGDDDRPLPGSLAWADPEQVRFARNLREPQADEGLLESVKAEGILQPVTGTVAVDGTLVIRLGGRRTVAAAAAAKPLPVFVIADERDASDAEIDRLVQQWDENEHRKGLTVTEKAAAVQEALDLGLKPKQVAKRLRLPAGEDFVAQAQVITQHPDAARAAVNAGLTFAQAAILSEAEGDEEAVAGLLDALEEDGPIGFDHEAARQQLYRDQRAAIAAKTAELRGQGITVLDEHPGHDKWLHGLNNAEGEHLTDENHAGCPGHAVWVSCYSGSADPNVMALCQDPAGHKHRSRYLVSGRPAAGTAEAKEDMRRVRQGNTEWRAAQKVRRQWLKDLLARKQPPKGAKAWIYEQVIHGRVDLRGGMERGHEFARGLLGISEAPGKHGGMYGHGEVAAAFAKASPARAEQITLGCVLGATEDRLDVHIWRSPGANKTDIGAYFTQLEAWGYKLSRIEKCIVAGADWQPQEDSGDGQD